MEKVLKLNEVSYLDLKGETKQLNFNKEEFASNLFDNSTSPIIDKIAKELFDTGEVVLDQKKYEELFNLLLKLYNYRIASALNDSLIEVEVVSEGSHKESPIEVEEG